MNQTVADNFSLIHSRPNAGISNKNLVVFLGTGSVALLIIFFSIAWAKDTTAQENEYKIERQSVIQRETAVTQARIEELNQHIVSLEQKAQIQADYAQDLRRSFTGNDGAVQDDEAKRLIADRDRLLDQAKELQRKLLRLKHELADLTR